MDSSLTVNKYILNLREKFIIMRDNFFFWTKNKEMFRLFWNTKIGKHNTLKCCSIKIIHYLIFNQIPIQQFYIYFALLEGTGDFIEWLYTDGSFFPEISCCRTTDSVYYCDLFYTFLGSKTLYIIIWKLKKFTIVNLGRV